MSGITVAVAVVLVALLQVTAAPLFPVLSAQADLVLVALALTLVFAGPQAAMVATPLFALTWGFSSDRSPALLLLALLPLLPAALWVHRTTPLLGRFAQTAMALALTGAWTRLVLALGAMLGGADAAVATLALRIVLPGVILDFLVFALAYGAFRLAGLEERDIELAQGRYRV